MGRTTGSGSGVPVHILVADGARRRSIEGALRSALRQLQAALGPSFPTAAGLTGLAVVVQQVIRTDHQVAGCCHLLAEGEGGRRALIRLALQVGGRARHRHRPRGGAGPGHRVGGRAVRGRRPGAFEDVAQKVDLVVDLVGGETLRRSGSTVREGGVVVSIVEDPGARPDEAGEAGRARGVYFVVEPDRPQLEDLARRADAGALRPVVGEVLDLADGARAFEAKRGGGVRGKVVLRVSDE